MYKEIPVQSRLIEKRFVEAENNRRKQVIQDIMRLPVQASHVNRSVTAAPNFSRKNQMAYMRHVEIETVNRKLLDNMNKILQSDYKSAVKTAISNRKFKLSRSSVQVKLKFSSVSTAQDHEFERESQEGDHAEDCTREPTHAQPPDAGQKHLLCHQVGGVPPKAAKAAQTIRCAPLRFEPEKHDSGRRLEV